MKRKRIELNYKWQAKIGKPCTTGEIIRHAPKQWPLSPFLIRFDDGWEAWYSDLEFDYVQSSEGAIVYAKLQSHSIYSLRLY